MTRYRTIVADPPWDMGGEIARPGWSWRKGRPSGGSRPLPYTTIGVDEIKALPIRDLTDTTQGDAYLYLWTTSTYLRDAFDVVRAWGFGEPVTLVWCKASRGFSMGGTFQNNVEFVLYATRSGSDQRARRLATWLRTKMVDAGLSRRDIDRHFGFNGMASHWTSDYDQTLTPTPDQWVELKALIGFDSEMDAEVEAITAAKGGRLNRITSRWFQWPRGEHSAKPEAFLDLVESVSPGPYVELFARRARFGWDYYGDESLGTAEMPA